MVNARILILSVVVAGALFAACEPTRRTLVIPDEMRRAKVVQNAKTPGKGTPESPRVLEPGTESRPGTYTLRLAESGRLWEYDVPESEGAYHFRIPIAGTQAGAPPEMMTEADAQLMGDTRLAGATEAAANGAADGGTVGVDGKLVEPRRGYSQKSYLGGLAKVNELYRGKRFELALIELVNLERQFPEDGRIQAMKGSLLVRLRKFKQAREAYERALVLNPEDIGVAEALREISEGE